MGVSNQHWGNITEYKFRGQSSEHTHVNYLRPLNQFQRPQVKN
jgi:hypothetical protein